MLPCHVSGVNLTHPPKVTWFMVGRNVFISLDDTKYWEKEYDHSICHYGFGTFYNYTTPPSFDCLEETQNLTKVYNCDYYMPHCYSGLYQCRVSPSAEDMWIGMNKTVFARCKFTRIASIIQFATLYIDKLLNIRY